MRTGVACAAVAGAALLSIASGAASAQTEAYTSTPAYLYAGPGQEYPVVAELPADEFAQFLGLNEQVGRRFWKLVDRHDQIPCRGETIADDRRLRGATNAWPRRLHYGCAK